MKKREYTPYGFAIHCPLCLYIGKSVRSKGGLTKGGSPMSEEKEVLATEEVVLEASDTIMQTIMHDENDPVISTKQLLEAGAHFGHQTRKWDPRMAPYIFAPRNGVYIIDLVQTAQKIQEAYLALKKIVADGGKVLFVGTKKQLQEVVQEEALRSGSFFVVNRWLGGTLTNFKTIQKRIRYLNQLMDMETDGSFDNLPKKEVVLLRKKKDKLLKNLDGIKEMRKVPNAVIVTDPHAEHNAVLEARKLGIPVFGLCDTNSNPDEFDYLIPANDDAVRSVKLIVGLLADAVVEAKGGQLVYAYNVTPEEEVSMTDALNSADRAEELKQIRQKAREDAQQGKKRPSKPRKRIEKKPVETKPEGEVAPEVTKEEEAAAPTDKAE